MSDFLLWLDNILREHGVEGRTEVLGYVQELEQAGLNRVHDDVQKSVILELMNIRHEDQ